MGFSPSFFCRVSAFLIPAHVAVATLCRGSLVWCSSRSEHQYGIELPRWGDSHPPSACGRHILSPQMMCSGGADWLPLVGGPRGLRVYAHVHNPVGRVPLPLPMVAQPLAGGSLPHRTLVPWRDSNPRGFDDLSHARAYVPCLSGSSSPARTHHTDVSHFPMLHQRFEWTGRDLNPEPRSCKPRALPLSYQPIHPSATRYCMTTAHHLSNSVSLMRSIMSEVLSAPFRERATATWTEW